mgnify:CR=1 FL=1
MIISIHGSKYIGTAAGRDVGEFVNEIYSLAHYSGSWITTGGQSQGILTKDTIGKARKLIGEDLKNNCRLIPFGDNNDEDDRRRFLEGRFFCESYRPLVPKIYLIYGVYFER